MEQSVNKIKLPSRISWAAGVLGERTIEQNRTELDRYATLLATELHRFDYLPDLLQNHPVVMDLLKASDNPKHIDDANRYLQAVNEAAGTTALYLLDLERRLPQVSAVLCRID